MIENPIIAHRVGPYLPQRSSWMYPLIAGVTRYRPLVLCKGLENLDRYPLDHVQGIVKSVYRGPLGHLYQNVMRRWFRPHYPAHIAAIDRHRPVLLHSHHADRAFTDLALRRRHDLPHVISTYGADIWQFGVREEWRRNYREMFSECALMLAEGQAMKRRIEELGCPGQKVEVLHLGVDLDAIEFQERSPDPDGGVSFLMAGRAVEKKGFVYGVRAFAKLAERQRNVRLHLITTDSKRQRETIEEIERAATDGNCADKVIWHKHQPFDEYIRLTRRAHVFLCPSVHAGDGDAEGGCPLTVIEMSAGGMPIVGSDHCDIPEVVVDGKSGFVTPERDVDALAERMEHLVLHPETWPALGRAGRAHIESEYNRKHQPAKLETLYDRVLS